MFGEGKTAVVTGGASGIGQAIAQHLAAAGARVVIADIEEPAIAETVVGINTAGGTALGVPTDVSDEDAMLNLRTVTEAEFGPADLLFLNAGVGGGGPLWESTTADWKWTLGVNLWGVIHGITTFVPGMVERNSGHVVNTASIAGLTSYPRMGIYNVTKHGVVTLSETLYHDLQEAGSAVGVSVLCPGFVKTQIMSSERNRPEELRTPLIPEDEEEQAAMSEAAAAIYDAALEASVVAQQVTDAIEANRFWILTDDVFSPAIALRNRDIEERRNPRLRGAIWEEQFGMAKEPTD